MLKALHVLKIFTFCPDFFGYVGKRLDKMGKINFEIYDVTNWSTLILSGVFSVICHA